MSFQTSINKSKKSALMADIDEIEEENINENIDKDTNMKINQHSNDTETNSALILNSNEEIMKFERINRIKRFSDLKRKNDKRLSSTIENRVKIDNKLELNDIKKLFNEIIGIIDSESSSLNLDENFEFSTFVSFEDDCNSLINLILSKLSNILNNNSSSSISSLIKRIDNLIKKIIEKYYCVQNKHESLIPNNKSDNICFHYTNKLSLVSFFLKICSFINEKNQNEIHRNNNDKNGNKNEFRELLNFSKIFSSNKSHLEIISEIISFLISNTYNSDSEYEFESKIRKFLKMLLNNCFKSNDSVSNYFEFFIHFLSLKGKLINVNSNNEINSNKTDKNSTISKLSKIDEIIEKQMNQILKQQADISNEETNYNTQYLKYFTSKTKLVNFNIVENMFDLIRNNKLSINTVYDSLKKNESSSDFIIKVILSSDLRSLSSVLKVKAKNAGFKLHVSNEVVTNSISNCFKTLILMNIYKNQFSLLNEYNKRDEKLTIKDIITSLNGVIEPNKALSKEDLIYFKSYTRILNINTDILKILEDKDFNLEDDEGKYFNFIKKIIKTRSISTPDNININNGISLLINSLKNPKEIKFMLFFTHTVVLNKLELIKINSKNFFILSQ